MHLFRKSVCVKNAAFYKDDLVCKKCGRTLGFRYKDTEGYKVFLFDDYMKYKHLLKNYFEIPSNIQWEPSMSVSADDIHKEIISELKTISNDVDVDVDIEVEIEEEIVE